MYYVFYLFLPYKSVDIVCNLTLHRIEYVTSSLWRNLLFLNVDCVHHKTYIHKYILLSISHILQVYVRHSWISQTSAVLFRNPNGRLVRHNTIHTTLSLNGIIWHFSHSKWASEIFERRQRHDTIHIFQIFRKLKVLGAQEIYLIPPIVYRLSSSFKHINRTWTRAPNQKILQQLSYWPSSLIRLTLLHIASDRTGMLWE